MPQWGLRSGFDTLLRTILRRLPRHSPLDFRPGIHFDCLQLFLLALLDNAADSSASAVGDGVGISDLGDDGRSNILRSMHARAGPQYQDKNSRNMRLWESD